MYSENQRHKDLRITKVMQKFQETYLASASSAKPVNLNKPIHNTLKRFQLKRMLNTTQVIKRYFNF